ncbi:ras-specific guanine nucleotide-releasing factor 2-like [Sitophilus oryzae]|uniref:Ras-specific guanine nucleotide-releasing factor 2-like n=1 Tax=Sitophilus oryzae TaxID=7048 RepID=A0A6J2XYZ2_SITOR|nr:ras-specific guanine nucleotide-releasing factor 2-like [Sitophilus oryzae]
MNISAAVPSTSMSDHKEPRESRDSRDPREPKRTSSSGAILSPKIQKSIKVNESQLLFLSERAKGDPDLEGPLWKKSKTSEKWQLRHFILYQNLLFFYEQDKLQRPLGLIFLEGSYVERIVYSDAAAYHPVTPDKSRDKSEKETVDKNYCFLIIFGKEFVRKFELAGINEPDILRWLDCIEKASFSKQHLEMQKVTAKHMHILQVVEAEQTAKWEFSLHCEELHAEMRFLREELIALRRQRTAERFTSSLVHTCTSVQDTNCLCCLYEDLQGDEEKISKLKKVQSFFRGWLCRRKWKQIVEQYIKSPHAERLRRRNSLVFQLVEAEEEYIQQMEVLITCFLRPFKMAASSKKPPCTHEDVNSIFLNSETVFFLHQIFLKGLTARLESWPTLVLGDLFSMLLPMLSIYQEYVRNHHYSLQVLTECKQNQPFAATLKRLESKPLCNGRSLETFLTYPMHQIPRYIITLHELLAHTPFEHVERKNLEAAQVELETLSKQMHDEVSETENIRKNLAIERNIVEGCDILLDVNQVFVRQGTLIQVPTDKSKEKKTFKGFKGLGKSVKDTIRQCFLFSYHLIVTTRGHDGTLHLVPGIGRIAMSEAILIEEPTDEAPFETQFDSNSSVATDMSHTSYHGRDFKIIIDSKGLETPIVIHLVAPTVSDKAAWISDIAQCIDNAQFSDLLKPQMADTSSINLPQYIKNDPRLFHDEPDIRFSRTLNSCKIPQIRYATPDRLLERLTDLRFLSIDFLNTFLLTYKVFTSGIKILTALKRVYYASVEKEREKTMVLSDTPYRDDNTLVTYEDYRRRSSLFTPRRTSGASSVSGYYSETSDRDRSLSYDSQGHRIWRTFLPPRFEDNQGQGRLSIPSSQTPERKRSIPKTIAIRVDSYEEQVESHYLTAARAQPSTSTDVVSDVTYMSATTSREVSQTVDGSASDVSPEPCCKDISREKLTIEQRRRLDIFEEKRRQKREERRKSDITDLKAKTSVDLSAEASEIRRKSDATAERKKTALSEEARRLIGERRRSEAPQERIKPEDRRRLEMLVRRAKASDERKRSSVDSTVVKINEERRKSGDDEKKKNVYRTITSPKLERKLKSTAQQRSISLDSDVHPEDEALATYVDDRARSSIASVHASTQAVIEFFQGFYKRSQKEGEQREPQSSRSTTARSSFQFDTSKKTSSKAGIVITSYRPAQRRSSSSQASTAFAIATCAADNPVLQFQHRYAPPEDKTKCLEHIISTAATMRVLNVLRHWISKQGKDFEVDYELKKQTKDFLEEIRHHPNLTATEHKAAAQLLMLLDKQDEEDKKPVDLEELLCPPLIPSKERIETLSALEIAEQLTYIDHQIFMQICPEELMGQAWMKEDKEIRAPHIVLMTRRFNEVSRLVASEILRRPSMAARVAAIEKWATVADIARCLHNFNGVLQICSAFTNAGIFRLKRTWEKVSKGSKQTVEKLQKIVSSDGRFRALRDALHRCDPPCIPYLGVYLTDLSFIEEGTPNFIDDNLLNFSKMRMIAHIIREIRHYQQTAYRIGLVTRVSNYLLDTSLMMDDDQLYATSLILEPRQARLTSQSSISKS